MVFLELSSVNKLLSYHKSYHILSYHIVDLKRQNHLKVGTSKPKLKVKMQSVSDDDVRKRLLEKPRFELVAKGVFRLGRWYIFWQGIPGLRASNWESMATDGWSFDRWHQKTIGACRRKWLSARKTAYWHELFIGSSGVYRLGSRDLDMGISEDVVEYMKSFGCLVWMARNRILEI